MRATPLPLEGRISDLLEQQRESYTTDLNNIEKQQNT